MDYKFKQDVAALDQHVCSACNFAPAGYVAGQLYAGALASTFQISFAVVSSQTDQTITTISPASSPWTEADSQTAASQINCGVWTIQKAGTKVQEVIRFTENLCGNQAVDLTFRCEYEIYNQNHLKLQSYMQETMAVNFYEGETKLLTF